MTRVSKLRFENLAMLLISVSYALAGVIFLSVSIIYAFKPPHIGIIGVLSFVAAFGVFRKYRFAVWMSGILFFLGITFGAITIYSSIILQTFEEALLFHLALIGYIVVTLISFVYVAAQKREFR